MCSCGKTRSSLTKKIPINQNNIQNPQNQNAGFITVQQAQSNVNKKPVINRGR